MSRASDLFGSLDIINTSVSEAQQRLTTTIGYGERMACEKYLREVTDTRKSVRAELHNLLRANGPMVWGGRVYFHSMSREDDIYSLEFRRAEDCDDDAVKPEPCTNCNSCVRCGCGMGSIVPAEAACG